MRETAAQRIAIVRDEGSEKRGGDVAKKSKDGGSSGSQQTGKTKRKTSKKR